MALEKGAKTKTQQLLNLLKAEALDTWFELGLFLDRFHEKVSSAPTPAPVGFKKNFEAYKQELAKRGVAFLTFEYLIDGILIELNKYVTVLEALLGKTTFHFIGGQFEAGAKSRLKCKNAAKYFVLPAALPFKQWKLYEAFFFKKLERGSAIYDSVINAFVKETLVLVERLGNYLEKHQPGLLFLANVNSNPGNVSLALACALVSDFFKLPVVSNNHDFYFDGGHRLIEVEMGKKKAGPRDLFFKNYDIGEVFSVIETLYPWNSPLWLMLNISAQQNKKLLAEKGISPLQLREIGTSIDTESYKILPKSEVTKAKLETEKLFQTAAGGLNTLSAAAALTTLRRVQGEAAEREWVKVLKPFLVTQTTGKQFKFASNFIFLQPTRILKRKNIEKGFELLQQFLEHKTFLQQLKSHPELGVTLLVTGPAVHDQADYLFFLVKKFGALLENNPASLSERLSLGFLFSAADRKNTDHSFAVTLPRLYNMASLILFPSYQEGRGLPMIEAAACGVPVFCRRYEPQEVFEAVVGEKLPQQERLQVYAFKGETLGAALVTELVSQLFNPKKHLEKNVANRAVVERRYGLSGLKQAFQGALKQLHLQLSDRKKARAVAWQVMREYKAKLQKTARHAATKKKCEALLSVENRAYLAGEGKLEFMLQLKSIIDPSAFRAEKQQMRGRVFSYAKGLVASQPQSSAASQTFFYSALEESFKVIESEAVKIQHDHSFSYRLRGRQQPYYANFTYQEFTGVVNRLFKKVMVELFKERLTEGEFFLSKTHLLPHLHGDLNLSLLQLTGGTPLVLDNRRELLAALTKNRPLAIFPGRYLQYEIEGLVLSHFRRVLGLGAEEMLDAGRVAAFEAKGAVLQPVRLFISATRYSNWHSAEQVKVYLRTQKNPELQVLYKKGLLRVVKTSQSCVGLQVFDLGAAALSALLAIKKAKGIVITLGESAAVMSDLLALERFHLGTVKSPVIAGLLGLAVGSGFVLYVLPKMRFSLAYPTPIQTGLSYFKALRSERFERLKKQLGEEQLLEEIAALSVRGDVPLAELLTQLEAARPKTVTAVARGARNKSISISYRSGVYGDGKPWSGVSATLNLKAKPAWQFAAFQTKQKRLPMPELIKEFERENSHSHSLRGMQPRLAWNGGYILNSELVGKLRLGERYIDTPLGLLVVNREWLSFPLFNKPALLFFEDGAVRIVRVSLAGGFKLTDLETGAELTVSGAHRNRVVEGEVCFFDLAHDESSFVVAGHRVARFYGNRICEILEPEECERVRFFPVGINLLIPKQRFPAFFHAKGAKGAKGEAFRLGSRVGLELKPPAEAEWNFSQVRYGVEAGPLLVEGGKVALDMKKEGWKSLNSIRTQAARLDYLQMRGPKIACGLTGAQQLIVLVINGRLREAVGATHQDMAELLLQLGVQQAMGFDPGGSSTLWARETGVLNISPYNKGYERDVYSLPPQPRAISNCIVAW